MTRATEDCLRFVPSAVEGLPGVTEVAVFPDRLELLSEGQWVVIRFGEIARRYSDDAEERPPVADRDWFHQPAGRFFRFYASPPVAVYMPDEPPELNRFETMFHRVQQVIDLGGFSTSDLG